MTVPANLGVLVDSLECTGYRVLVAQGGEEALKRASLHETRRDPAGRVDAWHRRLRDVLAPESGMKELETSWCSS